MIEILNQVQHKIPFRISLLKHKELGREIKPTHVLIFDSCPLNIMKSIDFLLTKTRISTLKKAKVIIISDAKFKKILSCSLAKKIKFFYHVQNPPTLSDSINILSFIINYDIYPKNICKNALELLSKKEHQVVYGFFSGDTVQNIAQKLCISEKTVYSHKRNAFQKLGFIVHDLIYHKIARSIFDIEI